MTMDLEKIREVLEACSKDSPYQVVQHLWSEEDLIKGILENLPDHYAKPVSHPIYSSLFELYRSEEKEVRSFVLQFVPVLVWIYLSATSRRDKQGYGKLEAILLAIYNAEVVDNKGQHNTKTFRLPSLSRPSIYHEPSIGISSLSALTESALSRHEQSETPIILPGPNRQLNRITAGHRMFVLCVVLNQYNRNISSMRESSQKSYCIMALRVAKAGFDNVCTAETVKSDGFSPFSNEELKRLSNHPRIPLVSEFIQELVHGLYFLMYNGQCTLATQAIKQLHFRAAHGLLAPAHVLTNAVHHSVTSSGGLPQGGPLGLQVHFTQDVQPVEKAPSVKTLELPERGPSLVALTTQGMEAKRMTVSTKQGGGDSRQNGEPTDCNSELDGGACSNPAQEKKTHKKSSSTGYWKIPFRSSKADVELRSISQSNIQEGGEGKKYLSEENLMRDRVTLLKVGRSQEEVSDTKL